MSEQQLQILFDEKAGEHRAFDGPVESMLELAFVCETVGSDHPQRAKYEAWAKDHGVDAESGGIITTAHNPDLLKRRLQTLSKQLQDFAGILQGNNRASIQGSIIPQHLFSIFMNEARKAPRAQLRVLSLSAVQQNVFFDLVRLFPQVSITVATGVKTVAQAEEATKIILAADLPKILENENKLQELYYTSNWRSGGPDVVAVTGDLHYEDSAVALRCRLKEIAGTGAKHIVLSDIMQSARENGEQYWLAQRSRGGVIPVRVPKRDEIVDCMKEAGYKLVHRYSAPPSFRMAPESAIAKNPPQFDNMYFVAENSAA